LIIKTFILSILLIVPVLINADEVLKPIITSDKDTVHIFIRGTYRGFSAFEVYRKGSGEKEYQLLTQEPVTPVNDPYAAQEILGTRYDLLNEWLQADNPEQLLHKMKTNEVATMLKYCGIPYAKILGRYYKDSTAKSGKKYNYRIILFTSKGKEIRRIEVNYTVKDELPSVKSKLSYEQIKDRIKLQWQAPDYKESVTDDFVGFSLYRQGEKEKKRLNFLPILRMEKILWFDEEVEEDKEYVYSIHPVDIIGREGQESDRITVLVLDLMPPLVPEGLEAQRGIDFIRLSWDEGKEKDIVHYNIFRAPSLNAEYEKIGNVQGDSTLYIDTGMISGKPYFYKIQAIDDADNVSLISSAVWSVAQDTTPPLPPTNITFNAEEELVTLAWTPSLSKDIDGYYIYRGFKADKYINITPKSVKENQFADTMKFYPGHTYYYGIAAVDFSFNTSAMETLAVTIPDTVRPGTPLDCYRTPTEEGFVRIGWQQSMSLDVSHYNIYRYQGKKKELIRRKEGKPFYFIDSLVIKGTEYSYGITAVDHFGNESNEVRSKSILPADITPPPPPENINFKLKEKGVEIRWEIKSVIDFKGCDIYRCKSIDGEFTKINDKIITSGSFFDKTGKKGLYYKIYTIDTSDNTSSSQIMRAK
jgi:fibronectin type 3 domain-containing protein